MATPLESFRSGNPTLYQYGNDSLIDLLWKEHGQSKYEDESIFREYLTTDTELFDKSRLQTITPTIELEQPELPEEKVNGEDRNPFLELNYYKSLLEAVPRGFGQLFGTYLRGAAVQQYLSEMSPEAQKLAIESPWWREQLGLEEGEEYDFSKVPDPEIVPFLSFLKRKDDTDDKFLRNRSNEILKNPDQFSPERVEWAEKTKETIDKEIVPIRERKLWKAGESLDKWAEKKFQLDDEFYREDEMANMFLQGFEVIGGSLGFIPAYAVGTALTGPTGGWLTGLHFAGTVGMGEQAEMAFTRKPELDDDIAAVAAKLGYLPGALDFIAVGRLMTILDRMLPGSSGRFRNFITQGIINTMWEVPLEGVQTTLHNVIAQLLYNADQETFEGIVEMVGPATVASLIMGGGVGAIRPVNRIEDQKEKIIEKEIGVKPTEDQKEKADEGSPDEVKEDFSPDGYPPKGAKVSVSEAGVDLGNGRIVEYNQDSEDGTLHVKIHPDDGSTPIDRPANDLDIVWLDKPEVVEEVTPTEEIIPPEEVIPTEEVIPPEEVIPTEEEEFETRFLSLSELLEQWEALPVGEGLRYKGVYYQKGRYKEPFPEEIAKDKEKEILRPTEEVVEEVAPTEEDAVIPPDAKIGDEIEVYNAKGEKYKTKITAINDEKTAIRVLNQKGNDVLVGMDLSATLENIRNPNYKIKTPNLDSINQGDVVSEMSDEQLSKAEEELNKKVEGLQEEGRIKEGIFLDAFTDRNAIKVARKEIAKPVEEVKPVEKAVAPVIQSIGKWNNQMDRVVKDKNEANIDELTQSNLENVISKETNTSVLKVTKGYLEKGKPDNEIVQKNLNLVSKRIAELEGKPVEKLKPEKKKPVTFVEEILSEKELDTKVEEGVKKETDLEGLEQLTTSQLDSLIDDIKVDIEEDTGTDVKKEDVGEKVKELQEEAKKELGPAEVKVEKYKQPIRKIGKWNTLASSKLNIVEKELGDKFNQANALETLINLNKPDLSGLINRESNVGLLNVTKGILEKSKSNFLGEKPGLITEVMPKDIEETLGVNFSTIDNNIEAVNSRLKELKVEVKKPVVEEKPKVEVKKPEKAVPAELTKEGKPILLKSLKAGDYYSRGLDTLLGWFQSTARVQPRNKAIDQIKSLLSGFGFDEVINIKAEEVKDLQKEAIKLGVIKNTMSNEDFLANIIVKDVEEGKKAFERQVEEAKKIDISREQLINPSFKTLAKLSENMYIKDFFADQGIGPELTRLLSNFKAVSLGYKRADAEKIIYDIRRMLYGVPFIDTKTYPEILAVGDLRTIAAETTNYKKEVVSSTKEIFYDLTQKKIKAREAKKRIEELKGETLSKAPLYFSEETKRAFTPENTEISYRIEVYPLQYLITSDQKTKFPAILQPRDRTSLVSQQQVESIAQNPIAERLGHNSGTESGAPIVGLDNVVESGNGRTLGLAMSYEKFKSQFYKYIGNVAKEVGENPEEVKIIQKQLEVAYENEQPAIVIRRRLTDFSPEDRVKFVQESNVPAVLEMTSSEQARIDSANMPEGLIDKYDGGELHLEKNADFVRGFVNFVPKNERSKLSDDAGILTQSGVKRIKNALVMKAFDDVSLFERISEAAEPEVKALSESFLMAAPRWIKLRENIENGKIPKEFDLTHHVIDSVNQIRESRKKRMPFGNFLKQGSLLETGEVHPYTSLLSTIFYRGKNYKNLDTAENISKVLSNYAQSAEKFTDLFEGEQTPAQVLTDAILNTKKEILPITEEELNGYKEEANRTSPIRPKSDTVFLGERGERKIDTGRLEETKDSLRGRVSEVAGRTSPKLSREERERLGESAEHIAEQGTGPINQLAREQESGDSGRRTDTAQPEQLDEFTTGAERGKVSDTDESRQQSERDLQYDQLAGLAERKLSSILDKTKVRTTDKGTRNLSEYEKQHVKNALILSEESYIEKYTNPGIGGIVDIKGRVGYEQPEFLRKLKTTEEELLDIPEFLRAQAETDYETAQRSYVALNKKFEFLPNPRKYFLQKSKDSLKNLIKAFDEIIEEFRRVPPKAIGADISPHVKEKDYQKAKPYFEKSWADARDAGLGLTEWLTKTKKALYDAFGKVAEYYKIAVAHLKRFARSLTQAFSITTQQGEPSKFQLRHAPKSAAQSLDTYAPIDLSEFMVKGMKNLVKRLGKKSIDQFVADELDYANVKEMIGKLGGEQVDAVALAIDQVKSGRGFILGDQTGVGKGRVIAAMLRWSKFHGKNAVFVTQTPVLYADMIRDLNDIGENVGELKILPTDNSLSIDVSDVPDFGVFKTPNKQKHEEELDRLIERGDMDDYDFVFTTYSQMQRPVGVESARHHLLNTIAENSIFILDESHSGGGQGSQSGVSLDNVGMTRAAFLRDLLRSAQGVMYSSATWAKHPKVMDLYMNTDIQDSIQDPEEFIDVMKKGSLPLQSIVSGMLAESGQYRRVEKSFKDIAFNIVEVDIDRKGLTGTANDLSFVYRDLVSLDRKLTAIARKLIAIDPILQGWKREGHRVRISPSNFQSQMHYIAGQLMTAMKIDEVAEIAIEEHKAGKKPMIVISRTMDSFLKEYAKDNKLKIGDKISINYNDLLIKYLERTKRFKVRVSGVLVPEIGTHIAKDIKGEYVFTLNTSAISQVGEILGFGDVNQEFEDLKSKVKSLNFKELSVKPIDDLIEKLEAGGLKVKELTGRDMTINKESMLTSRSHNARLTRKGVNDFNAGNIDALVMNRVAGTGLSMHASEDFSDKKQRHMIVLEAEPNVTDFVQILGRINRTGQVTLPQYSLFATSHPAEKRIAAMLERKMASLNASTSGSVKTDYSVKGIVDFMNATGDKAVKEFLQIHPDIRALFVASDEQLEASVGIAEDVARNLLVMDPATANQFYEFVLKRYSELKAEETGLGVGRTSIIGMAGAQATVLEEKEIQDGLSDGSPFQRPVYLQKIVMKKAVKPFTNPQLRKKIIDSLDGKSIAEFTRDELSENKKVFQDAIDELQKPDTQEVVDPKNKQDRIGERIQKIKKLYRAVENNINQFRIGSTVQIRAGIEKDAPIYDGIIINRKKDTSKNPTTTGSIQITFALANGESQQVMISLFRFLKNDATLGEYTLRIEDESKVKKLFEEGQRIVTENRYFIAGNIPLGSSLITGGNYVNIQKRIGDTAEFDQEQGILMPKTFDPIKAIENMPIKFSNHDEIYQYFLKAGTNAKIKNYKGDIELLTSPRSPGLIFIRAKKGAKLILKNDAFEKRLDHGWKKIARAFAADFNFVGQFKLTNMETGKNGLYDVAQHLDELGLKFQTITNREAAKSAKADIKKNNAGEGVGGSVGAMKTPKDMFDAVKDDINISRDSFFKRMRNSMTAMARNVSGRYSARKNPRVGETRQFYSRSNEHLDNIIMPETEDINIEKGVAPKLATGILDKVLTPFVVAKRFIDKSIYNFVNKSIEAQSFIRTLGRRLERKFLLIKSQYKKADSNKVHDILWSGDAAGRTFTVEELKEGFEFTNEEKAELKKQGHSTREINRAEKESKFNDDEIAMYFRIRRLFEAVGRLIDKHNFRMIPSVRRMKALHRKRMEAQVESESISELTRLFARKFMLERQLVNNINDATTLQLQIEEIDEQIFSIPLRSYTDADFSRFKEAKKLYEIEEGKLRNISVRKRTGYVPHLFFGSFKIRRFDGIDEKTGQEIWKNLVVPATPKELSKKLKDQGRSERQIQEIINDLESSKNVLFYSSAKEAKEAAERHLSKKGNEGDTLKIEPVDMRYMMGDATVLSDREYNKIMGGITSSLAENLTFDQAKLVGAEARALMRRKSRRRTATFAMKRRGIPGYDKNLNQVFKIFAKSVARYRYMDELKYEYVNLMEKKGWGEVSEIKDPDGRTIAQWLETYWRDLNNEYQNGERRVDRFLNEMSSTFVGNPKLWAIAGITSMSSVIFGMPLMPAALGGFVGYSMYKGMKAERFKSRAITGEMLSISAHMKLGAFFNLSSAIVNLSQLANVYTKHGALNTTAGFRRGSMALYRMAKGDYEEIIKNSEKYSAAKVNAARDAMMLAKYADVRSEYFYTDENPDIFTERSKIGEFSMMWFQGAETINRATSFFAGFHQAEKEGKNRQQSIKIGQYSVREQQFSYDNSAKPEILRSTLLRVPLQFKNWLIQQLTFMGGLRGWEWSRFLAIYFLLAGALGNTFLALADFVLRLFGFSPMQYIKEWSVEMAGKGETEAMVGQLITRGLPAVVSSTGAGLGLNTSSRIGIGDKGIPTKARDFYGPLLSTFINMHKLDREGASIGDHIANITPAGKTLKAIEAMAAGMPLESAFTDFPEFSQNFMANWRDEQEATIVDPYHNRNIKIEGFSDADLVRMMIGFQTTKEAQVSDFVSSIRRKNEIRSKDMDFIRTRINNAIRKYKNNPEKMGMELQKIVEEAMEDGVNITYQGIKRMIIDAHLSLMDREFRRAPKHQKEWILNNIQNMESQYGSEAIGSYID